MNTNYGDGLLEAKRLNLHNLHKAIFVYATFSDVPWYADAVSNQSARQESYFLRDVVPFIERALPAKVEPSNRLLVGFSKSGWGAFSLLLRHPHSFGKAAAWDAPLAMQEWVLTKAS
jgi:enterochelin esterase-like enzyme